MSNEPHTDADLNDWRSALRMEEREPTKSALTLRASQDSGAPKLNEAAEIGADTEALMDAHESLNEGIEGMKAAGNEPPIAIYKAMHALTYALCSRDEPQGADMMQRCTDMLADVPGATLEDKMTKYIGEYMALQLASRSQAESASPEEVRKAAIKECIHRIDDLRCIPINSTHDRTEALKDAQVSLRALSARDRMSEHAPLQLLEAICGEIYERWDKDMRSGKLLQALAGTLPNYRADVTAVRDALSRLDREMFKCNCPHEVRSGCSEPKCPHYAPPHSLQDRGTE